jgi:hypothetical protein
MSELPTCACGRVTDGVQTACWPCQSGNTRGGFYGPREPQEPRTLLLAECRACDERIARIDALLEENDALAQTASALVTEVKQLTGQLAEAQAAAVRATKQPPELPAGGARG